MDDFDEYENSINEEEIKEILNKINTKTKQIKFEFTRNDINTMQKIFSISDLNFIQKKKEKQRNLNIIINTKSEFNLKYDLDNNKYFLLMIYYYICKYYKILPFVKIYYMSNLISFHTVFLFFDFFFEINEENINDINFYILNIISIISNIKKIIKVTKKDEFNNKELNEDILNLLGKIFNKINRESITNIIFCKNIINYPKILSLLKLCYNYYNNDVLDDNNKNLIINNLKILFSKNLNNEHLNYLYNVAKKFLKSNFNNQTTKPEKYYFSFYKGIIEFFMKIFKGERNSPYLLDKYFIFNSSEGERGIIKTSPINLKEGIFENNLSIIFSFRLINQKGKKSNIDSCILSVNDAKNNKFILRFSINNEKLNLSIFSKNIYKDVTLFKNIQNDVDNLCFIYIDEKEEFIHFHLNEKDKKIKEKIITKEMKQIYVEIGNTNYNNNNNIKKFNGLIGPVLVFNSKINNPLDTYQKIYSLIKYNFLGEYFNSDKNNSEDIYFSYDEHNGILNNKKSLKKVIPILKQVLENLIFYINPEVISNNLNFYYGNKFRDYQIYNNPMKIQNYKNDMKFYEINDEKNINNIILIQNSFIDFAIKNKLFDFFIFNIELIYNKLLLITDKDKISENEFLLL